MKLELTVVQEKDKLIKNKEMSWELEKIDSLESLIEVKFNCVLVLFLEIEIYVVERQEGVWSSGVIIVVGFIVQESVQLERFGGVFYYNINQKKQCF